MDDRLCQFWWMGVPVEVREGGAGRRQRRRASGQAGAGLGPLIGEPRGWAGRDAGLIGWQRRSRGGMLSRPGRRGGGSVEGGQDRMARGEGRPALAGAGAAARPSPGRAKAHRPLPQKRAGIRLRPARGRVGLSGAALQNPWFGERFRYGRVLWWQGHASSSCRSATSYMGTFR
jgi:hypothetical protein